MFGSIAQLGPRLAMVIPDGRTERNEHQVQHPETWNQIFDRLDGPFVADSTQHLLVIMAVPFSFIRVPAAEAIFEFLKNRAPVCVVAATQTVLSSWFLS